MLLHADNADNVLFTSVQVCCCEVADSFWAHFFLDIVCIIVVCHRIICSMYV